MIKPDPEFLHLLPLFKKKLFNGLVKEFSYQVLNKIKGTDNYSYGFDWLETRLTDDFLIRHFYDDSVRDQGFRLAGTALGFRSVVNGYVKRIVWDIDKKEAKDLAEKLLKPKLDHLGIEYIEEISTSEKEHISIFTETKPDIAYPFIRQLMAEIGEPVLTKDLEFLGKPKLLFDEVYGGTENKENKNLRFIYGYHLKRMQRYYLEFQGEQIADPVSVLKAVVNMKPVTEDFMKSYIKEDFFPVEKKKTSWSGFSKETYKFFPLELEIPNEKMPIKLRPIYRNCPARNELLNRSYDKDFYLLNDKGDESHYSGFMIAGDARYHDIIFKNQLGREWFHDILLDETRFRDYKSHNWWHGPDNENPTIYSWRCDTVRERFNLCDGCPHEGRIESVRELLHGNQVSRTPKVTNKKLVTLEHIRNKTFVEFYNHVKAMNNNMETGALALASPMGAGKTKVIKDLVIDMVKNQDANVLISVHDGDSALAYKKTFDEAGIDCFVCMSHANIFRHQDTTKNKRGLADYDCLYYGEIQSEAKAGVQSQSYKSDYCASCPLVESCHYPNQYTQVKEPEYKVIIIQHAHLSCREVLHDILKKNFNLFVLDENFLSYTFDYAKLNQVETELLETMDIEWCSKLADWLSNRSKASGKLEPTKDELESVYETFKAWNQHYRVPDLVRFYNQARLVDPLIGIEIVYEIPKIPIIVFTDATQDIELTKQLTGIERIDLFGENEIIDIQSIHPDNKRIQIVNTNNSKERFKDRGFFNALMTKICEIIEKRDDWKKVLITCYGSERTKIDEFVTNNFPLIKSKIDIGLMNKGTNKWALFDAQFILAGRYGVGKHFHELAFRYKSVANYFRSKKNKKLIINVYPDEAYVDTSTIATTKKDYEANMVIGGKLRLAIYKDFKYIAPLEEFTPHNDYYWHTRIFNINIGDMEQVERIRWKVELESASQQDQQFAREVYHLHPYPLRHLLVTDVMTLEQFFLL